MDDLERELSGIMFTLFLVGTLTFTFNIQLGKAWTGTVYIRADGSIDPSDAPIITYDNVTYTLTDNITSSGDGIVVERDNIVVDGAGYTVQGTMEWSSSGIDLSYRSNVTIKNVGIKRFWFGIEFFKYARNNNVSGNRIINNNIGASLDYESFSNTLSMNNITNNYRGVYLYESSSNSIFMNSITNNYEGFELWGSSSNSIFCNEIIKNNGFGIYLSSSDNNNISLNNITNNTWGGVYLFYSSDNRFCHNNFINNTDQVDSSYGSVNTWDDGYPSGGNYWSDYTGVDNYTGPYQDETGSDGIGDTPYVIDENNVDHYPLMYPYGAQTYKLTITTTFGGTTTPSPGTHIYANGTIVEVTAIPNINCSFAYWLLDGANIGSTNPIDVLMTANHTLQAVFTQTTFQLTILTTTDGTTNPLPDTYTYVNGTKVSVTAIPNTGFSFACWLLDGENRTENPITVVMDANHTLEAYFVDDIPPEIGEPVQDPPSDNVQPYQNVTIRVNVTDYGAGIRNVTLWYSLNNGTSWTVLNMTELPIPSNITITYEALIPGYENCTWVSYKIVAYDNAGNNSTKDNNGYGYKYHVIPEFPSAIILPLFIVISVIAIVFAKKTRYKKPKHSQSSPSFLRYSVSQSKM